MNDAILTQMDFLMLCLCLALIPLVYSMSPDMDAQAGPLPRQRTKALLTMDTPLSGRPQLVGTEENATKDSEVSGAGATCPEVTVTRKILNEGFHRHLVSQVTIAGFPGPVNGCKVLFKEMLPNGLYLDPYQLASLQEHNLTEAVLPDIVDVEAPAYLSAVHTAFIFTKPEPGVCTECFRSDVPVHIRYHQPSGESGEAFVALKRPQLLIHCSMGISCPFAAAICTPLLQLGFTLGTCSFELISGAPLRSYGTIANGPHALTQYWWLGATFLPFSWTSAYLMGRPCGSRRFHVAFWNVDVVPVYHEGTGRHTSGSWSFVADAALSDDCCF